MPHLLVSRLQRFAAREEEFDGEPYHQRYVKLRFRVKFDEFLDLSPYTADNSTLVYRLDGVVHHGGKTVHNGHYIATAKDIDGTWSVIDDMNVVQSDLDYEVVGKRVKYSTGDRFDPYVLVYTRIS